jgi:hypothetical protein
MPASRAAPKDAQIWKIAQVMHEAVRAWQKANGESGAPPWSRAPKWMKDASREAVLWRIANPYKLSIEVYTHNKIENHLNTVYLTENSVCQINVAIVRLATKTSLIV